MSEYTPTTAEVEDWYAYDEWDTGPEEGVPRREEFRRWHAAEVRRAKAEALREAADYFARGLHCADMRTTPEETVRDLRNRAE